MATTIAEALAGKKPRGEKAKNESLRIVYAFVKLHIAEIEGAREMGYSWMQIEEACRELMETTPNASKIIWRTAGSVLNRCYRAVKKGVVPGSYGLELSQNRKRAASKKYSVEVTEE